ncbi:PEP-CTERM sorting domain-containing protein [Hydrogenophaga sp. PBL-H3]|uniref:PEP-CTERM sorting domain-containing protein n=1 Tax=Hydrogenophaga sp. PBL-H3 TaxID=434010 RepID=UPI00135B6779|nr:PEP-CTERM sorting domain-containing protein [Hydrogenophaga sp. PBL-H3]
MNKHLLALVAAAALAGLAPAQAATYTGVVGGTSATVADYSADGLISFDIDFSSLTSTTLGYTIDAADLLGGLSFNAVLRNFTGEGISAYTFGLSSGTFGNLGTVTRQFGGSSDIAFNGANATVSFSPLEFLDVEIGDPLGQGGVNWTIAGLSAGDSLNITVSAVPEPESLALLLSGLGVVGWVTRRRRKA